MLSLLFLNVALAEPMASSELPYTGHTLPKGAVALHIFGTTGIGVTDALELKTSLFGLVNGPNLGLEYAVREGKKGAVSLGLAANTSWRFNTQAVSGNLLYTMGGPLENRFNLGLGAGFVHINEDDGVDAAFGPTTWLLVGYDIVPKPRTAWQLYAGVDPYNSVTGRTFAGSAGFSWNHSWEVARLRLGAVVVPTDSVQALLDVVNSSVDLPAVPVIPVPTFDVWWRF